jgi:hypothetical protein
LVWVELAPLRLWLDPATMVEALLLAGCCNSTSGTSLKAMFSRPSAMVDRFWMGGWFLVEVWGKALSPDRRRHWLTLLGDIFKVIFDLGTRWAPNVGT